MALKNKVDLALNNCPHFYIDFTREGICSDKNVLLCHLSQMQIRIIRYLCSESQNQNDGIVTIGMISDYLYPDDSNRDNHSNASRAMYNLRNIVILKKDKTEYKVSDFIDDRGKGRYKILLSESPFEEQAKTTPSISNDTDIVAKNELLSLINAAIKNANNFRLAFVTTQEFLQPTIDQFIVIHLKFTEFYDIYKNTSPILSGQSKTIDNCFVDFYEEFRRYYETHKVDTDCSVSEEEKEQITQSCQDKYNVYYKLLVDTKDTIEKEK